MPLPRSHSVIDHQENGLRNFLTVCGGSLTTHRSMAEDVVNKLGNKLGINTLCSTDKTPVSNPKNLNWIPSFYFQKIEKEKNFDDLVCECEAITKTDIEELMKKENLSDFHDIRRRIRVGFGPCQGTFCNSRLAEIVASQNKDIDIKKSILNFWSERLKGSIRTSYGDQAKQILLSDYIHQENFGLRLNEENSEKEDIRT